MARCPFCQQGTLRMIAAITQGAVIRKILRHLKLAVDPPPVAPARLRQESFAWFSTRPRRLLPPSPLHLPLRGAERTVLRPAHPPQGVPLLPLDHTVGHGHVLYARTRVYPSLARTRYPSVCTRCSHRPSAAPSALQALC